MTSGFGAVPEELRQAAEKVNDAIGRVAEMVWQGPSGPYGHDGIQHGWAQFIDDMKSQVHRLRQTADEHGRGLVVAAATYTENESAVEAGLGKAGAGLDAVGGAGAILGGGASAGFAGSDIASRLNPVADMDAPAGPSGPSGAVRREGPRH